MGAHYERARLLFQQSRFAQAEQELREELAELPHWGQAHAFLGRCLAKQNRLEEAQAEGEEGVRLAPDLAYAHYTLGLTFLDRNQLEKAGAALTEALRLEPRNPEQLEWMSWIQYQRGDKYGALATAEQGLAIDPQHVGCLNRHGYYLRWLGLWRGSEESLRAALKIQPENAYTHTNLAWTLWSKAHKLRLPLKEALTHFQEGLRLDPTSDWAKAGVADVLLRRTRGFVLPSAFALAGVLILVMAALSPGPTPSIDPTSPEQRRWVMGWVLLICGVALIPFSPGPAYLAMCRTRLGAAVLSPARRRAAKATAGCLCAATVAGVAALLMPPPIASAVLFVSLTLIGPLTTACEATPGWARKFLIGYVGLFAALALAYLAVVALGRFAAPGEATVILPYLLGIGSILSQRIGRNVEKMFAKKAG